MNNTNHIHTMKAVNRIFILAAGILFATLCSCELDEYNPSGVTAEAIWSTPEGFETAIAAAYSYQRDFYGKENAIFMNESGTDLWFNGAYKNYSNELSRYQNFTPLTGNFNKSTWPDMYQAVNSCNMGIEQIENVEYPSEEAKNAKLSELLFLRAWYNWHIVEFYGGVTLRKEAVKSVLLTAQRSPVNEWYELIIADLRFAVEHLPVDQGQYYSRATRQSALGLLARTALTGAYHVQDKKNEYLNIALNAAKDVIDNQSSYGVELWTDIADVYNPGNNKKNKEALYVASNSTNDVLNIKYGNRAFHYWSCKYYNSPGLQRSLEFGLGNSDRFMPTLAMLDFYNEEIDARYETFFREAWLCNDTTDIPLWTLEELTENGLDTNLNGQRKFFLGDTALLVTKQSIPGEGKRAYAVYDRDYIYLTGTTNGINPAQASYWPGLIKFDDPFREDPSDEYGSQDVILIRLAEMYLVAAEASLQLGDAGAAAGYINVIRTRAAKPGHEAEMQITAGDVDIDFILDERARELCGEWIRWFDLKRTGKLIERVHLYNPDITQIQDYHVLRPIPQAEMDALLNAEEYGQNEGYGN